MQVNIQFQPFDFKIKNEGEQPFIFDIFRRRYVVLSPEEWVRQNLLHTLITTYQYPKGLLAVEKEIKINQLKKRFDAVVYDRNRKPWLLIECKAPHIPIDENTLLQTANYLQALSCPYFLMSNGKVNYLGSFQNGVFSWLERLPTYNG